VAQRQFFVIGQEEVNVAMASDRSCPRLLTRFEPEVACDALLGVQREHRDAGPRVLADDLVETTLVMIEETPMVHEHDAPELAIADPMRPTVASFRPIGVGPQLDESCVLGVAHEDLGKPGVKGAGH
jgi:hypothetical protein